MTITIDEAIKIKQKYQYILQDASLPELIEADNLGIEALYRCQEIKNYTPKDAYCPLPGETKD